MVALLQGSVSAAAPGPPGLTVEAGVGVVLTLCGAQRAARDGAWLFLSAFATTEFQAVQFMPAAVIPQALLCGPLIPRTRWRTLYWISNVLPLSYAVDALLRPRPPRR